MAPRRVERALLFLAPLTRGGRGGWFSSREGVPLPPGKGLLKNPPRSEEFLLQSEFTTAVIPAKAGMTNKAAPPLVGTGPRACPVSE